MQDKRIRGGAAFGGKNSLDGIHLGSRAPKAVNSLGGEGHHFSRLEQFDRRGDSLLISGEDLCFHGTRLVKTEAREIRDVFLDLGLGGNARW